MAANSPQSVDEQHCAAEIKQLQNLVGGTIITLLDGGESFGFRVTTGDGTFNVWVDADPEGNDPGHLNIEPA